jgi:hypothetical protein
MSRPTDERLREVFNTLEPYIENRYGIPVKIRDVPDPFSGDLDGAEIHVDYDEDIESAVFVIAHLFGHTVQWNTCEESREIGYTIKTDPSEEWLKRLVAYETDACRYSLQLFHDAGVHDLDQWVCDYSACDLRYLLHFYRSGGERLPFKSFWQEGAERLDPLPIPEFHPTQWVSRFQGIVV